MNARKWSKIEVPACWEQQGFGGYTYGRYYSYERDSEQAWRDYREHAFTEEYGIYRHIFDVPRSWSGKQRSSTRNPPTLTTLCRKRTCASSRNLTR